MNIEGTVDGSIPRDGRRGLTYREAGVDIDKGNEAVARIARHVARTLRPGVLGGVGGFGGLFQLDTNRYPEPILVAGADGVGTKLQLAFELGTYDTIGQDCVAMCVNDIVVHGAEPLFFLDYIACGELRPDVVENIVQGVADGCQLAGCALLGGETAEMPGSYPPGEFDIAGFAVGVVNRSDVIDGRRIEPGDVVVGLRSSGVHSNGYSLVRRVLERAGKSLQDRPSALDGLTLGEELMKPTRIYSRTVLALLESGFDLKGLAHITGGGLTDNIPRCLPENTAVVLRTDSWVQPPIFSLLQTWGDIVDAEMRRTFNCGLGLVLVVPPTEADDVVAAANERGEVASVVGEVVRGEREVLYK